MTQTQSVYLPCTHQLTSQSEGFPWTEVWRVIPSDSSWVHLVINISETQGIVVYKNGVLGYRVNKGNLIGVSSGYPIVQFKEFNYQRVGKGTTSTDIHNPIVDGEIKNLRIYNKPLTEVEVNDIYSTIDTIVDSTLVNGNSDLFYFYNGSNLVSYLSSNGNWKSTGSFVGDSDDRIKSHEREIVDATETLNKLTPKIYDKHPFFKVPSKKEDTDLSGVEIVFKESGLIAQEVMNDAPELEHLVIKPNYVDGLYGVNYIGLIPYLIKANKELNERLKLLEGN